MNEIAAIREFFKAVGGRNIPGIRVKGTGTRRKESIAK